MRLGSNLRRGRFACSDGPNRFVGDDDGHRLSSRDSRQNAARLAHQHFVGFAGLAFGQDFSHAHDRDQLVRQRGLQLLVDQIVGLGKILPPLGVAEDDVGRPDGLQHQGRDLAGVGALVGEVHILRAHGDTGARSRDHDDGDRGERRAHDDLVAFVIGHQRQKVLKKLLRLGGSLVHFPIGGDERLTRHGRWFLRVIVEDRRRVGW
jgi:hypothetical protein